MTDYKPDSRSDDKPAYKAADKPDDKPADKCPPFEEPSSEQPCPHCKRPSYPDPPKYTPPERCEPACECPDGSSTGENCLEKLIDDQTKPITAGDKAKAFKTELEKFLDKAKAAKDEYTKEKYQKLVGQWVEEDRIIVDRLHKLKCSLSCWDCVIDCYVCPLLYDMRDAELRLNGNGTWCSEVHDLQDLLYWQTRDKSAKERFFNRIKDLLAAWEKPASAIDKILSTDNPKLISDIDKALGTDPSKAVFDLFLRLIPLHLAIAPASPASNIDSKYTQLCSCDDRPPLCCCGIDTGERSLRQRFIGPQPSLIEPGKYFDLICCLVKCVYLPAKDDLSAAEANVTTTQSQIKRFQTLIDDGLKNFEKNAKAAIPIKIDCDEYPSKPPSSTN